MKLDAYEREIHEAYEAGKIKPVVNKAELQRLRAAARVTAIKDRRINIRLSSGDLQERCGRLSKEDRRTEQRDNREAGYTRSADAVLVRLALGLVWLLTRYECEQAIQLQKCIPGSIQEG